MRTSLADKVKGHIPRSKVILGQILRKDENVKFSLIKMLKCDCNQTWAIDATWEPLLVDKVKGHISRSKVIRSNFKNL